jgi:UDP-2,3-diacylglucosamine pyrophosphatase LpxH
MPKPSARRASSVYVPCGSPTCTWAPGIARPNTCRISQGYQADRIYLVGDIIDGWKLRGGIYWPQAHTNVIRRLLTMSKRGTEVIYVTGNHDEFLRRYSKLILGNIQLVDEAEHLTADGRRLLVIHGDQFDVITRYHRWLAFLGDRAYEFTLVLNRWLNHWRPLWLWLLVAVGVPQAQGQGRGELHQRFRGCHCPRVHPARLSWGGVRAYTPCRNPQGWRGGLPQLR